MSPLTLLYGALIHLTLLASAPPLGEKNDVAESLFQWQALKFGIMMHWGPYSQWGVVESWSLCSEDEDWCRRHLDDYTEYKKRYEGLQETFNPTRFNPTRWAKAASDAGMKYVVFTTKHHDGFCMFDSAQTDYKITSETCPFSTDPRADVTKAIFEAFRARDFLVGTYFSKPDWHSDDYWWKNFATPDRNVNYSIEKYPERWERFKSFTYNQIRELMTGYGKIDILWLDGGWVRPISTINDEVSVWCKSPEDQDIDMPRIVSMARELQPGLLVVDRTVHGAFEDYRTPEQQVPDVPPDYPWETCMTMADQWSFKAGDRYKSVNTLIHLLIEIVAKGGNFLLNVGPEPSGEWSEQAYDRLEGIASWMSVNAECIHGSSKRAPYKDGKFCFTKKDEKTYYAIYLAEEGETLPETLLIPRVDGEPTVHLLGWDGGPLDRSVSDNNEAETSAVRIGIPEGARRELPNAHAWVFRIDCD